MATNQELRDQAVAKFKSSWVHLKKTTKGATSQQMNPDGTFKSETSEWGMAENDAEAGFALLAQITDGTTPVPPPALSIQNSIADGATLSGTATWIATVGGFIPDHVDFVIDGAVKWTERTSPYGYNGDAGVLDTTGLTNGSHKLEAVAYDASGEKARATSNVTVQNAVVTPPPPTGKIQLGVYRGAANPTGCQAFGTWLGKQPTVALEFLGYSNWTDNEGAAWNLQPWSGRYRLSLSVCPWPNSITSSLAEVASGVFNPHFVKLAQNLINYGHANAIIRPAWEFTVEWMKWAVKSTTDAANYAAMYRQIVNSMRSVAGQQFQFDWNPVDGTGNKFDPFLAWPGDAYVDYISLDVYDNYLSGSASEWQQRRSFQWGIDYFIKQAVARNKLVAFPEWGLVDTGHYGRGDHPEYIQWMYDLISKPENRVAYHCYFDYQAPDGAHKVSPPEGPSQFPNGSAKYKELFSV